MPPFVDLDACAAACAAAAPPARPCCPTCGRRGRWHAGRACPWCDARSGRRGWCIACGASPRPTRHARCIPCRRGRRAAPAPPVPPCWGCGGTASAGAADGLCPPCWAAVAPLPPLPGRGRCAGCGRRGVATDAAERCRFCLHTSGVWPACRACSSAPVLTGRGLCKSCFRDEGVLARFPRAPRVHPAAPEKKRPAPWLVIPGECCRECGGRKATGGRRLCERCGDDPAVRRRHPAFARSAQGGGGGRDGVQDDEEYLETNRFEGAAAEAGRSYAVCRDGTPAWRDAADRLDALFGVMHKYPDRPAASSWCDAMPGTEARVAEMMERASRGEALSGARDTRFEPKPSYLLAVLAGLRAGKLAAPESGGERLGERVVRPARPEAEPPPVPRMWCRDPSGQGWLYGIEYWWATRPAETQIDEVEPSGQDAPGQGDLFVWAERRQPATRRAAA